jgi:hypothetical protein
MIRQKSNPIAPLTEFAEAALASAAAYKADAVKLGFSVEAAEALAVTFHSVLMASVYDEVDNDPPTE